MGKYAQDHQAEAGNEFEVNEDMSYTMDVNDLIREDLSSALDINFLDSIDCSVDI